MLTNLKLILAVAALGSVSISYAEGPETSDPIDNQQEVHEYPMTIHPVTSLEDGKFYYIYDTFGDDGSLSESAASATYRYAFRKANDAQTEVHGTHKKPINAWVDGALDNFSVWKAIASGSDNWKFQNVGTSTYMGSNGGGNIIPLVDEANATAVVLEEVADQPGTFKVRDANSTPNATNNNALRWDGRNTLAMTYYNGEGHPICFYEAVPENNGYTFVQTPNTDAPEYTIDSSNPHYYLIQNLRVRDGRGPTYASAPGATGQISLRTEDELKSTSGRYELGALWYFMPSEGRSDMATPHGYNSINIYNALTGQALANVLGGDWRTEGDDIVWYIVENTSSGEGNVYSGYNILSQPDKTNNGYGWNNASGHGLLVEYYKGNDPGSIFAFEPADETLAAATIDAIVINRLPLAVEKGEKLKALGVNTEEAIAAWDAAVDAAQDNHRETTIEEYQAVVSAYINLQKSVKEVSVKIKHKSHDFEYLGVDTKTGNIGCIGDADDETVGKGTRVFTLLPTEDGSGFYLYNVHSDCYIVHPSNNTDNVSTTTEKSAASVYNFDVWVNNGTQADGSIGIYEINSKPDFAYLRSGDSNNKVVRGAFNSADASWFISTVSDEAVEGDQLAGAAYRLTGDYILRGNALVELDVCSDEAVSAWQTALSNFENADPYTYEIIDDVNNAYTLLTKKIKNVSVTARHKSCGTAYISVNQQGSIVESADRDGTRALTLSMAEGGTGFNIFSEYAGKYLVHPAQDNASVTLTPNKSEASVYNIDALVNDNKTVDSFLFGDVNYLSNNPDRAYFNTNTNLDIVTRWSYGAGSAWYLSVVDEDQAANEYLNGAKAEYSSTGFSTEVGQYRLSSEGQTAAEAAMAVETSASVDEKRQAGNTLRNLDMELNMPQPGHIYEFANNYTNSRKSLSCENRDSQRATMVEQNIENLFSTLFYLDEDYHLVALENGRVLGNFTQNDNKAYQTVLVEDTDYAGVYTFGESRERGKYTIMTHNRNGGTRYLFNAASNSDIDCGDNPDERSGYCWAIIDKGAWTPIPGTDVDRTSIVLPFAMNRKDGMTLYTAKVNNGKMILTEFTDNVIPGNVPFLLDINPDVQGIRDNTNHLVYLEKATTEGNIPENNDLCGAIYAKSDTGYVVRNGNHFAPCTDDYIKGFCAHFHSTEFHTISNDDIETALDELDGKVFAIKNGDIAYNRGYLIYDPAHEAIWTSGKNGTANAVDADAVDAEAQTNTNYHWTLVKDNTGRRYLYSIAAQKFAGCYTPKDDNGGDCEFVWHFSDYPTAIDFCFFDFDQVTNLENAEFNIIGGEKTGDGTNIARPAGMQIINGNGTHPVAGVSGNTAKDGCGFLIKVIADATPNEVASADDALEAMAAEHSAAKDYIGNHDESYLELPGHFNADAYAAFSAALEGDRETAQAKYYQLVRARHAAGIDNINKFEDGQAYVIEGKYASIHWVGSQFYVDVEPTNTGDATDYSNIWLCTKEGDNVNFTHTFGFEAGTSGEQISKPAAVRGRAAAAKVTEAPVSMFAEHSAPDYQDGMGNILVAETPVKVIALAQADDATGIAEITAADSNADAKVYDLQGRRVSNATRGLYIVNGVKTLVK